MHNDDAVILYILIKQSLGLGNEQVAYCAADAVEHILVKYFMLQVLAVKHKPFKVKGNIDNHLCLTTNWLGSNSKKTILVINDETWNSVKNNFQAGIDVFCLKNHEINDSESTMVLWPEKYANIPDCLK